MNDNFFFDNWTNQQSSLEHKQNNEKKARMSYRFERLRNILMILKSLTYRLTY